MSNTKDALSQSFPTVFNPNDTVEVPRLMTAPELAAYLSLSRMQVSRLVKAGKLRACKFGTSKQSSLRFLVIEVLEDLEKLRVVPSEGVDNE